ncbi:DUF3549 family protein [Salinicola socius]|uniref:DUF3549 domain-containing protein n=1 Tax=Salinicola socius TaxID=404433 RepID=A0A1Q8SSI7_9GAMM|nr:DUF3549 family protein [Salinicola socius]OLO04391.1 hypothetical protein BTW07_09570 [Salinicola socius]
MQTLSDFFTQSGAELALSTLGRRVEPMRQDTFAAFEQQREPWPMPWNGQAQVACALRWPATFKDPAIWFLSLPLDEQGLLVPAARDEFLDRLLQTLSTPTSDTPITDPSVNNNVTQDSLETRNLMQDNPLAFEPELHQRALLHARLSRHFGQPPSMHSDMARRYLIGDDALDWQMLGLQGLADQVVAKEPAVIEALASRLTTLPRAMTLPLCYLMEHGDTPVELLPVVWQAMANAREAQDIEAFCALLRALLGSDSPQVGEWLDHILADDDLMAADCLAAIAARGWQHLEHEIRLGRFLERLANCKDANFRPVVRDLALIPRLRLPILMMLRQAPADSSVGRLVREWNA